MSQTPKDSDDPNDSYKSQNTNMLVLNLLITYVLTVKT